MIRSRIQICTNCELCNNMKVSPIATEFFGTKPSVLIICGSKPTDATDVSQEVISGSERKILVDLFYKAKKEFAITFLVKCKPNPTYKKKHIQECIKWISKEIDVIKPSKIIGLGADVQKYCPNLCGLYLPAPALSLNNKKSINKIIEYIQ